jgi:dTDP-4-amino-4,6-dideoxygalactose transaminase
MMSVTAATGMPVLVDKDCCGRAREQFLDAMAAAKIGVGVHYLAIPAHPYYQQNFGWRPQDYYPNATAIGRRTVSLPLSPKLTNQNVSEVIEAVRTICMDRARMPLP